jgi:cytochrome c nitrite reductase small subunit
MERTRRYAVAVLAGVMTGLSAYAFVYARGFSYFSNDPVACANCHAMRAHYDAWLRTGHHAHAACNDCHTPHAPASKYLAEARNGWNHSLRFTLQDYPDPIRIRSANAAALEANCVRCHAAMTGATGGSGCVRCHAGAGHGGSPR